MRRLLVCAAAAGLLLGLWLLDASQVQGSGPKGVAAKKKPVQPAQVCTDGSCGGEYGTAVKFFKSPSEAARQALKEEKLVCVLHVSGDFEDPDFT